MARRLHKTAADYLTIAVAPALIMALVTSLVFFLLLVFYRGGFPQRLQYILFLFVFAAVLIARIAMEEGRERATLFSLALGLALMLTLSRFSDLSMIANIGFIALIWWCADRLTWDCTLIDERENAAGEGLLQTVGLDQPASPGRNGAAGGGDVEPLGVTARNVAVEQKTWYRRAWDYFHQPHAPGVWVVYFSLAALPIFGVGQRFIPEANADARRAAFLYLVIYVASALGLLLATCFLGLRRYLRQRRVEMPDKMAITWIATGVSLIAVLLLFCTLLPRPSAEYAVSQVPIGFSSPTDLVSSWLSFSEEGVNDDPQGGSGVEQSPAEPDAGGDRPDAQEQPAGNAHAADQGQPTPTNPQQSGSDTSGEPRSGENSGGSGNSQERSSGSADRPNEASQTQQSNSAEDAKSQDGASEDAASQNSSGSSARQSPAGGAKSDSSGERQQQNDRQSSRKGEQGGEKQQPSSGATPASQDRQSPQEPPSRKTSEPSPQNERNEPKTAQKPAPPPEAPPPQQTPPPSRPPFDPARWFSSIVGLFGALLKLAFYAVLLVVGVWLFRKYKDDLLAGFRELWKDFREFWERLFGRKPAPATETAQAPAEVGPRYRPFSSYPDPFATGKAGRYTPEQLVKYSFEAFEAWARERGCPRHPEQTPHEFAQAIGARHAAVSFAARALAELYSRLAYASGPLPPSSIAHLQQLWAALRS